MVKQFLILVFLLVLLIGFVAGHSLYYDRTTTEKAILAVSKLTKVTSPSLSVAYYEPRLLEFEVPANPSYPEMPAIDRTDFIYEK